MFDKIEDILKGKNTQQPNPTEVISTNDRAEQISQLKQDQNKK